MFFEKFTKNGTWGRDRQGNIVTFTVTTITVVINFYFIGIRRPSGPGSGGGGKHSQLFFQKARARVYEFRFEEAPSSFH
jgi:hypothetical protein